MNPEPNHSATADFLEQFRPGGPWLLTAIKQNKQGIKTRTLKDHDEVVKFCDDHAGWNQYFAVNPAVRDMEKKAERTDIASLDWLHVDCDPRLREPVNEERIRIQDLLTNKLPEGVPPPTIVIFSGGGLQGFWRLAEPVVFNGDLEIAEDLARYNRQIEFLFGGDSCHDISRIMRLPGTINWPDAKKIEKGRVPTLAELILFDESCVYPLTDFAKADIVQTGSDGGFSPAASIQISGTIERLNSIDELAPWNVPDRVKALCVQGNLRDLEGSKEGDDSRSGWLMDALANLARSHVPDEVMYSIITDPDFLISESVLDKGTMLDKYARRQIGRAKEIAADPRLADLNERFAVIESIGGRCRIVEEIQDTMFNRFTLTFQTFADFRNRYMHRPVPIGDDGHGNPQYMPEGHWWLGHLQRRQYHRIIFDPSRSEVHDCYNMWKGFAYPGRPGDPAPFLDHLRENLCRGNDEHYTYLVGWMARVVQQPASPGQVAVILRGPRGTGKSFFGKHFGNLFGRHYMQVSNSQHLVGNFNAHMRDCLVLFADEAFFAGDKRHESVLKTLITEDMITIESKGYDIETNPNFVHLIMASNEEWVVPAGQDERRFFVLDVGETRKQDLDYFGDIDKHMNSGGYEALLHYLQTYDLSGYEVRKVPQTLALQIQKHHTMKPEEDWWYGRLLTGDLMRNGEGWPPNVGKKALHELYIENMRDLGGQARRLSEVGFSRFIKKVCPDASSFQSGKHGNTRPYFWNMPNLATARLTWSGLFGTEEWPEVVVQDQEDTGVDIPF